MKKNKDRKRKVLPVWAMLLVVFACIGALVGCTVLALFFMGRLKPEVVAPGALEFSVPTQVNENNKTKENMAFLDGTRYDLDLASNVQLIYASGESFYITLQTVDKDIVATQTAVELSLSGSVAPEDDDVTLKNNILQIPRYVNLYKPFEVKVDMEQLKSFTQQDFENFVAPIITAKSENNQTSYVYAQIFVDLPVENSQSVQNFDLDVTNSNYNDTEDVFEVYESTQFVLEPKFNPQQSGQLFLQPNTQKQVFYSFLTDSVRYDWNDWQAHRFFAEKQSEEKSKIDIYTFKNSYYQKTILEKFSSLSDHDALTNAVINYFNSEEGENSFVHKEIWIKVKPVTVDEFNSPSNKTFAVKVDKYFTLTANSAHGNGSLDIELWATVENRKLNLKAFLGNVGIKIDKEKAAATQDGGIGLQIEGGQYMQCTPSGTINLLNSLPENYLTDQNDYYVLANNTPADANDYYWQISTAEETSENLQLSYNLFHSVDGQTWQTFGAEQHLPDKTFSLTASKSATEPKPEWKNNQAISVTMNFGGEDSLTPQPKDLQLSQYYASSTVDAVYKTVKYFLVDENKTYQDGHGERKTYADIFGVVGPSVKYDEFDNRLFELEDGRLHIYQALSGSVKVVVATIKTNANGKIDRDANGNYKLIQVSDAKIINIESNLSINMLSPTFEIEQANINATATVDGAFVYQVYLPVGNLPTQIGFSLKIDDYNIIKEVGAENASSSAQRLLSNWQNVLWVQSLDQDGLPTQDVALQSLALDGNNTLSGQLNVSNEAFNPSGSNDTSKNLSLRLLFDDGTSVKTKSILGSATGKDEEQKAQRAENVSNFLVYYPQARKLIGEYEKDTAFWDEQGQPKPVQVVKTRTQTTIEWGSELFEDCETKAEKIAKLNQLLEHNMIDQYGFVINKENSRYVVRMEEITGKRVLIFDRDSLQDFASTQGRSEETSLCAYVWDSFDGKFVYENGLETGKRVQGNQIAFNILSEGIHHIEKSSNTLILEDDDVLQENFVTNQTNSVYNNTVVRVEKYMAPNKVIKLANLLRVYTSTSSDPSQWEEYTEGLSFTLADSFIDSLTTSQRLAIMKMLQFNQQEEETDIYNLRTQQISTITTLLPFGGNTVLEFLVTDKDNNLFNFHFQLVCRADTDMNYDFSPYASNYNNWVNNRETVAGVFGGQTIDLKDYINFSTSKYGNQVQYSLDKIAINNNGNTVVSSAGGTKIFLADVYQFTQVGFTVYYGVDASNEYALSTTVVLYVNPNIAVVSQNSSARINLFDFENNNGITNHFNVYKATDYYDYLYNGAAKPQTLNSTLLLENVSANAILQAEDFDNFVFAENATNLSLTVGGSVAQQFVLKNRQNGNALETDAVFVVEKDKNVEQISHQASTKLNVFLTTGSLGELAQTIFGQSVAQNKRLMQVVNYQGREQLLLGSGKQYTPTSAAAAVGAIKLSNVTGALQANTDGSITTQNPSNVLVSLSANSFLATKYINVSDDKILSVSVNISAIISQVGTQLVNYTTPFLQNGQNVVCDFSSKTFETLITQGFLALEQENVFQDIGAGQTYTIVWDSNAPAFNNQCFGFVYDSSVLRNAQFSLSVVENATGYISGLAHINQQNNQTEVVIGDLATGMNEAFVVLRVEFSIPSKTPFVQYFRLKVSSNFQVGSVIYPYAEDAEYLDTTSAYFNPQTQTYEIDLNETLSSSNSANKSGTRFPTSPTTNAGKPMANTTFAYRISKVQKDDVDANLADVVDLANSNVRADGFLTDGAGAFIRNSQFKIKLKDNSAKITLQLEKVFYKTITSSTQQQLFGTDVYYTLRFNQGKTYNVSVLQQTSPLLANNGVVDATLVAGSLQTTFTINIEELVQSSRTPVKDYHIFLAEGSKTNALQNFNLSTSFSLDANTGTGTLSILPVANANLVENSVVSFGFYTNQKVAFVLRVNIVSAYTITTLSSVQAGASYGIGDGGVVSVKDGSVQKTVAVENISQGMVHGISLQSLTDINATTITFAHLAEDVTFTFRATVENKYTFVFEVEAQKDINLAQTRNYLPGSSYVGGDVQTVEVTDVLQNWGLTAPSSSALLSAQAFKFENVSYADLTVAENGSSLTHHIENVGGVTNGSREILLSYTVDGHALFTVPFTYLFTVLPNVETAAYYPNPTGQQMLQQEYVGTQAKDVSTLDESLRNLLVSNEISGSQRISDGTFAFSGAAEFSSNGKLRVEATAINGFSSRDFEWRVYVSNMFNVSIVAKTFDTVQFVSNNNYQTLQFEKETQFFFILTNPSQNGRVEFQVFVNEVPLALPYNVIVVPGSTITVGTNAPNYAGQAELIYAEDLARYEEKELFKANRILQYKFKSTVPAGTTYNVQFSRGGEIVVKTITAQGADLVNLDLGRSFDNFTFKILSGSQEVSNLAEIFDVLPKLTSRFVVKYYNGSEIASDKFSFSVRQNDTITEASKFTLTKDDLGTTSVSPVVTDISSGTAIPNSTVYNLNLKTSFDVQGNADNISDTSASYHTEQLEAGNSYSLLGNLGFGIYNPRENAAYTAESMAKSGGTLLLQMYGFGDLKLAGNGDKLQQAANTLHKNLINQEVPIEGTSMKFKYFTGLNPRAGTQLVDGIVSGGTADGAANNTNANNYITISGKLQNGSTAEDGQAVDYIINAGGANNNGNHVMMRLTYRVDIGGNNGVIEISHNILFLVLPNSSISFRTSQSNPNHLESADNTKVMDTEHGQSIASNVDNPFVVEANVDHTINLNNSPETGNTGLNNNPAVVAHMYGTTENAAKNFTYTYKQNAEDNYNQYKYKGEDGNEHDEIVTGKFTAPKSELGIDRYYIDFVNNFGYKARFYFNVLASSNPQISRLTSSTLTEGQTLKVGAQYTLMGTNVTGDNYTVYQAFDYVGWENVDEETKDKNPYIVKNELELTKEGDGFEIQNIRITFELQQQQNFSLLSEGGTRIVPANTSFTRYETINWSDDKAKVNIFDATKPWTAYINQQALQFNSGEESSGDPVIKNHLLIGSKILIGLQITGTPATLGHYGVVYKEAEEPLGGSGKRGDKTLSLLYSENANVSPSIVPESDATEIVGAEISDIPAYAFSKSFGAVDNNVLSDKVSDISNFTITKVAFKVNGQKPVEATAIKTKTSQRLITRENLSFWDGSQWQESVAADSDDAPGFTVPYFDGWLYGTNSTLNDVVLQITINKGSASNIMEYPVTIMRQAAADAQLLANDGNVLDGSNPTVNADTVGSEVGSDKEFKGIYNDTLEVELQPYESVALVLSTDENDTSGTSVLVENSFGYAVTRYVGISANVNGLTKLEGFNAFYLKVASHKISGTDTKKTVQIYYNGKTVSSEEITLQQPNDNREITFHNGLNIENIQELVGRTKQITLHLLATTSTDHTYQYAQTVTIHPVYNSIGGNSDVITAQDYYKLSSGPNATGQYLVPLSSWADGLELVPSVNISSTPNKITGKNSAGAYKFRYEINTTQQGAGSAIIDENGNIITTSDFDVNFHRVYVNVYMKVSGVDGSFSDEDTDILLNSSSPLAISLATNKSFKSVPSVESSGFVSVENTPVALGDVKLYRTFDSSTDLQVSQMSENTSAGAFAAQKDTPAILKNWFDDLRALSGWTNKHYHVLSDTLDEQTTLYNFNNYDQFTFGKVGKHTIQVAVTGRNGSGSSYKRMMFNATVLVQDSNVLHEQMSVVAVQKKSITLPSGFDWYEVGENNVLTFVKNNTYTVRADELGIVSKQFIRVSKDASATSNATIVDATFYVCSKEENRTGEKAVKVSINQMYSLSNLEPATDPTNTYVWYRLNGISSSGGNLGIVSSVNAGIVREDLTHYTTGKTEPFHYVLIIYNSANNVEECILYNVSYDVGAI